jgi:hypothetical protein
MQDLVRIGGLNGAVLAIFGHISTLAKCFKNDKSTRMIISVWHSVVMMPVIPFRTIHSRAEILRHIDGGKTYRSTARQVHHSPDLIGEIGRALKSPKDPFAVKPPLGAPRKVIRELIRG